MKSPALVVHLMGVEGTVLSPLLTLLLIKVPSQPVSKRILNLTVWEVFQLPDLAK